MKEKKVALITGITGQDGSYLAELLLKKGYEVHGLVRRSSSMCNRKWIDGLDIQLHYGDMTDPHSLDYILRDNEFDEIYNLAGQTHVGISFENPTYTFNVNTIGVLNLLESCRKFNDKARIYQASTSEMLASKWMMIGGRGKELLGSNEETLFEVHSPYACSKLAAHELCKIYSNAYGMFICCGLLFNHESPRRGDNFVTQKIVKGLINKENFELGNIDTYRDWGYAGDYVEAMWLMLQQDKPSDYVIATNESHSVSEFIEECCSQLNLNCKFLKEHILINETIDGPDSVIYLKDSQKRPWDVQYLRGDPSKAKRILGWEPKIKFKELIKIMIKEELKKYEK